jgi:apolipoprotein N-acyltransferase
MAILSGILQVLIFPSPSLYFLCWIALAPLIIAILRARDQDAVQLLAEGGSSYLAPASLRQGFLLGYASGIVWYLGTCYWIYHTMHVYGGVNSFFSVVLLVLFALYLALYHGLFGVLLAISARKRQGYSLRALVLAPFLWVSVELARTYITGFPWDLLGTAQVNNVPLARIATFTGVYGVSFEIALVNAAFAAAALVARRQRVTMLIAAVCASVGLQVWQLVPMQAPPPDRYATLVQENLPLNDVHWDEQKETEVLQDLEKFSVAPKNASAEIPGLIVWPESPAPFFVTDYHFRGMMIQIARERNSYVIAGSLGIENTGREDVQPDLFNSAVLITPDGKWTARYDKNHLVPFGEYIPFQSMLSFAKSLTHEVGSFKAGHDRKLLSLGKNHAGTFICYESIFPDEVRLFADNGADLFINISDDGWYGETGAPGQHLNMARMRAIENQRWLLRSTNTGITAAIDPFGRVVMSAPRNVRAYMQAPFAYVTEKTFYTEHGDWFPILCVIISLLALIVRQGPAAQVTEPQPV